MAQEGAGALAQPIRHWEQSQEQSEAMLADHHLGQQFEANGRHIYIAFVLDSQYTGDLRRRLDTAGLDRRPPCPDKADMCRRL